MGGADSTQIDLGAAAVRGDQGQRQLRSIGQLQGRVEREWVAGMDAAAWFGACSLDKISSPRQTLTV